MDGGRRRSDGDVPALPARPDRPGAADPHAVRALLDDLQDLRLGLSADLGLVAAAVELDVHDVATSVLDGRRQDLADLTAELDRRARREQGWLRRNGAALRPAAPALAAAAGLVTVLVALLPVADSPGGQGPRTSASAAADAARSRPTVSAWPDEAADEARTLQAEISRIMAAAPADPTSAQNALDRLATQLPAVDDARQREGLAALLEQAQQFVAGLRAGGADAVRHSLPRPSPLPQPTGVPGPAGPAVQPQPAPPPPASPDPGGPSGPAPAPSTAVPTTNGQPGSASPPAPVPGGAPPGVRDVPGAGG